MESTKITEDQQFYEIIQEIANVSSDLESECINQTTVPLWKVKLSLSGIQQMVFMAEEILEKM